MAKKYNVNDYITIYPNESGWKKIKEIIQKKYGYSDLEYETNHLKGKKTEDGGYTDQMWCIMQNFGDEMYFNGQSYFKSSIITLCTNPTD
jgi:hypothetical protein